LKIEDGGAPSWIYQNVNNFRMDWAFWLKFEMHTPWHNRIGKFHQKCKILKIQDGGRPPCWIYQNVNNFCMDWAFGWNLNCIYLGVTEIGKCHQKCEIFENPDGAGAILDLPNVNNFRMDWAFAENLNAYTCIKNWKISSEERNFENPRWRPAAISDLPKC